jgi:hypothetical protein
MLFALPPLQVPASNTTDVSPSPSRPFSTLLHTSNSQLEADESVTPNFATGILPQQNAAARTRSVLLSKKSLFRLIVLQPQLLHFNGVCCIPTFCSNLQTSELPPDILQASSNTAHMYFDTCFDKLCGPLYVIIDMTGY